MADDPVAVLDFWLGEIGPEGWYSVDAAVDQEIRDRFGDLWQAARDGGLEHWCEGTVGSLAFLILTDQFPRNMFRGEALAFTTDPLARDAARKAIVAGWDLGAPEPERQFFYLPLEHSEAPEDQATAVRMFEERMPETGAEGLLHAHAHAAIIARFGRFPFRNAALGRASTPEEEDFLSAGAYAAEVRRLRG
ncbi:DUF924 domain-containing protein [Cereibacter sphaeroides]|uniref:DUF924 family protein n=1 Tax=Cereibacter sphaeroides TaxID=1063 RepID=UPI001F21CBB6|nr:DUF924 family protein [Cereibacter sphaeroides]MCE6952910.1 DUF924 domain-containing protein [Cereibacter sphaeroides]